MAKILSQNPGSTEAQSPLIAGLSEGLSKISDVLNLKTATFTDLKLTAVPISETDKNRIYEDTKNRLWLNSPPIIVKKNNIIITPESSNFEIDYVGGSISFDNKLLDSDVITVTGSYIIADSTTINTISQTLTTVKENSDRYKGYFDNLSDLKNKHPTGESGDIALVVSPNFEIYGWNNTSKQWETTQSIEDLSNYYTKTEADALYNKKEPTINPKGTATTDDEFYYGGRKTWQNVNEKVRNTTLKGLDKSNVNEIDETDTVLQALGKLQGQSKEVKSKHYISGNSEPTTSTVGEVGQRYVNTSNGNSYKCISVNDGEYTWVKEMTANVYDKDNDGVIDNAWSLNGGMEITENTDLNNLLEVGNYYCRTSAIVKTLKNKPNTIYPFALKTLAPNNDNLTRLVQEVADNNGAKFIRTLKKSADTWQVGEWQQAASTKDVEAVKTIANAAMPKSGGTFTGKVRANGSTRTLDFDGELVNSSVRDINGHTVATQFIVFTRK